MFRTAGAVAGTVRDINRLQEVARILIRHGLGILVSSIDIPGIPKPNPETDSIAVLTTPDRAVAALQELGPTFIKLGQVLSTRPDVVPPAWIEAFQELQDNAKALDLAGIRAALDTELPNWQTETRDFDETPLATASIAQVHRATLLDGRRVVFKVQRPGAHAKVRADLSILHLLARRVLAEFPEAGTLDVEGVLTEFERSISAELDFLAEAENMRRFGQNFADTPELRVPRVIDALTTRTVLCAEFLDGVPIRRARELGFNMDRVGERYLRAAYDMLFHHGFFHGDLHPGNVLVMTGEVLGLLDFGMVGRLTREMKDSLVSLLFALERGDHRAVARIFYDIAIKEERVDYGAFERDVIDVVDRHWSGTSFQSMQIGRFLMDVTRGSLRHRVRAPPAYTMFFKALLTTEGLAKSLIPEVDPLAAAQPYVRRLVTERYSEQRLREDLFYSVITLGTLAHRLPTTVSQLLDDVDRQRLRLIVQNELDPAAAAAADRRQNRMILAIFAVTGVVCGTLTLSWDGFTVFGYSILSGIFYLASFPLFVLTLWMTLRNRG